jgi:hypothetical protein
MITYLGVNLKTGLSASKRDVDTGALVGHESRQGLNLVGADVEGVTDTALARGSVVRVLSAVAADHLDGAVVALKGEVDLQHVRAGQSKYSIMFLKFTRFSSVE